MTSLVTFSFLFPACEDLIRHMLVIDPERRYTTEEIFQHHWMLEKVSTPSSPCLQSQNSASSDTGSASSDEENELIIEHMLQIPNSTRDDIITSVRVSEPRRKSQFVSRPPTRLPGLLDRPDSPSRALAAGGNCGVRRTPTRTPTSHRNIPPSPSLTDESLVTSNNSFEKVTRSRIASLKAVRSFLSEKY